MRFFILLAALAALAVADHADADWARLTGLDKGPTDDPKTADEAQRIALAHLKKQEAALRSFIHLHGADPRAFEAHLRLLRLLNLRADLTSAEAPQEVAELILLAKNLANNAQKKAEIAYAEIVEKIRKSRNQRPSEEERLKFLEEVRAFQKNNPKDRRVPALLVEAAAPFESMPGKKSALLLEAKKLTQDSDLLARISDDQKRLAWIGKKLPLRFLSLNGNRWNAADHEGRTIAIIFFATWSQPSLSVFSEIEKAARENGCVLVAISLDLDRPELEQFIRKSKTTAVIAWDGKGWGSPLILALGVNAIPSFWLLDSQGILRTLDALDDPSGQIRKLLR